MQQKLPHFHSIPSLYGCFAQGRSEPERITLYKDWSRLSTDDHGEMRGLPIQGFFAAETQFVTFYQLLVNRRELKHRFSVQLSANQWSSVGVISNTITQGDPPEGIVPEGSLEVSILRTVDGGWIENITLRNNSPFSREAEIILKIACPIDDMESEEEFKSEKRSKRKGIKPKLIRAPRQIQLHYNRNFGKRKRAPTEELTRLFGSEAPKDGQTVRRSLDIYLTAKYENSGNSTTEFDLEVGPLTTLTGKYHLAPRSEVTLELKFEPTIDSIKLNAPSVSSIDSILSNNHKQISSRNTEINTSHSALNLIIGQARVDLDSLKLPVFGKAAEEPSQMEGFAAGVPRYIGVFGRDTLITAWQSPLFNSSHLEPALSRIAQYRGVKYDSFRDEEPHRLLHERRLNPTSAIGKSNRELYYGDVTSTPFWIVALGSNYRWLGDRAILERHQTELEDCCDWIETRMEEGNGFIYYKSYSPESNRNQAWKDSGDAIVTEKGEICTPPLALVEIQGYAFAALNEASHIFEILGKKEKSIQLKQKAEVLKKEFNEKFWIQPEQYYAIALKASGDPIRSIASNIGHCLGFGIVPPDRCRPVVERLMSDEMFTGWGIRTLSNENPAYDPFSYHRGSVWTVENASIANGLFLSGFAEPANRIITSQLALATVFQHMRLPEVISGHSRGPKCPSPGLYPYANLIQAWSVSAISQFIQTFLGIQPNAPKNILYLDPHLPEWLSWLEIKDLRIGKSALDILFSRELDGKSNWKVTRCEGTLEIKPKPTELGFFELVA